MKMLKRILYILPIIGMVFASCVDIESKDFEHIGGYNTMDNEEAHNIMRIFVHGRQQARITVVPFFSDGLVTGHPKALSVRDIWHHCRTVSIWFRCGAVRLV